MSVGEEAFVVHRHRPRISLCSLWYKLLVPHKEEKSFFSVCKGIQGLYCRQELIKATSHVCKGSQVLSLTNQCPPVSLRNLYQELGLRVGACGVCG